MPRFYPADDEDRQRFPKASTFAAPGVVGRRAYVGKAPPGWKEPTRYIIGKCPPLPSNRVQTVKRSTISTIASDEDPVTPISKSGRVSKSLVPTRAASEEIPFEENGHPNSSNASFRTLVNNPSQQATSSKGPPSRQSRSRIQRYHATDHEIVEDAGLVAYNETIFDDQASDSVPVRLLRDFAIYELGSKRLVSFEQLQEAITVHSQYNYGASGCVESFIDEDEDTEDEIDDDVRPLSPAGLPQRVALLIRDISVHHVDEDNGPGFKLNQRVYLQTKFAWYILVEPASQYVSFYAPFWIKHQLFHELISSSLAAVTRQEELSLDDFKHSLTMSDVPVSQVEFEITADHLECQDTLYYIAHTFESFSEQYASHLSPLKELSAVAELTQAGWSESPDDRRSMSSRRTVKAIQTYARDHHHKTLVTPKVYAIAEHLFPIKHLRRVAMAKDDLLPVRGTPSQHYRAHDAQMRCQWVETSETTSGHYNSAIIDGIQYNVGDSVVVEKGRDANSRREKHAAALQTKSGDQLVDKYWFAKICYMFERLKPVKLMDGTTKRVPEKFFHGQWYYHGSKLLLHETAHPQGLFLTNECDDNSLYAIVQKCDADELDAMADEPPANPEIDGRFFSSILWDQTKVAFCDLPADELRAAAEACAPGEECFSCGLRQVRLEREIWTVEAGHLSRGGVSYHIHDFVYIRPGLKLPPPSLYVIGQIVEVVMAKSKGQHRVKVRLLERYDTVLRCGPHQDGRQTDERCLILTEHIRDFDISDIEGKAYAAHPDSLESRELEDWVAQDDHFLVKWKAVIYPPKRVSKLQPLHRKAFTRCKACHDERMASLEEDKELLKQHGPLRCLELFAGAGGLAAGLHDSGFVGTKWAVELASSAALSFSVNNPDCTVYNQCSNVTLQHAVDSHYGRKPKALLDRSGSPLPSMPKPGDVDFISGGPPCQSFSGANHYKKVDDIRTTLIGNMLSYVEFYRPKYFLLENVVGLLCFRLGGKQRGPAVVGGMSMGVVKFIFRTLIALGYQVHCKVLQAAQYGAPQGRERVIFWGARRDVPLPDFPFPTHNYLRGVKSYVLPTGEVLHRPVRVTPTSSSLGERDEYRQYAPFAAVTIEDAIGDLRKFDWINPGTTPKSKEASAKAWAETAERGARGIRRCFATTNGSATTKYAGYCKEESYLHEPLNRYQLTVRKGLDFDAGVRYHYTNKFSNKVVERVVNVPLRPNANHTDLPDHLQDIRRLEDDKTSKQAYRLNYGRLDRHAQFRTTITTVKPNTMNGCVLHPMQKRVLTIRECARAQGFPDSHTFESTQNIPAKIAEDQLRQIGNAVPVPLALALGKELGKALLKMWRQEKFRKELSPEVPMEVDEE